MLVLPSITAPSANSLPETVDSYCGTKPCNIFEPAVVCTPSVQNKSLMPSGIPVSGRAVPLASALCLAVACRIEGTLPNQLARKSDPGAPIRVGNPSGVLAFGADVRQDGGWVADSAGVYRTARCLMKGAVSVGG